MKPDNLTTSLSLSRELKEAKVPQVSTFYWHLDGNDEWELVMKDDVAPQVMKYCISGFLAEEIGRWLPYDIPNEIPNSWVVGRDERYFCAYETVDKELHAEYGDTMAECMGKMLLYLLRQGLLSVKDLK